LCETATRDEVRRPKHGDKQRRVAVERRRGQRSWGNGRADRSSLANSLEGASLAANSRIMKTSKSAAVSTARAAERGDRRRPGERPDDGNAFVPDNIGQLKPLAASDAEAFAEEFIGSATGAESVREDAEDEVVDDEEGGPFIVLDDNAKLPPEPSERNPDREGHEPVQQKQMTRGAKWAARGG
jgi:hypothetical protein